MTIENPPAVSSAFWKGKSSNKPLVMRFSELNTKTIIFSNVTKLKGKKNESNRSYRVAEHLSEEMMEQQLRQRQIVSENAALTGVNKMKMNYKKGKLHIAENPYQKKVTHPSARSILSTEASDLSDIKELTVSGGYSETEGGSRFIVYASKAKDLQAVRRAYLHICKVHSEANHVTMAYRLAGLNKAYDEDYVDDREYNAGRKLLSSLIDKQSVSTVVFIVRYYGGKHIGKKRFEIHQRLLQKALSDLENNITFTSKLTMHQTDPPPPKHRKRSAKTKHPKATHAFGPRALDFSMGAPRASQPYYGNRFHSEAYNRYMTLQQSPADDSADSFHLALSAANSVSDSCTWSAEPPTEKW